MIYKIFLTFSLVIFLLSCSKKEPIYKSNDNQKISYEIYREAIIAFDKNDFFFASKKFSEAELSFREPNLAAKSALMASFCLYAINFYIDAEENLNSFIKKYPGNKNIVYAHYLLAIIQYEQIQDEKRDLKPLIKADKKINFFLEKYPESEYAIDLKFKKDLIQNQLAAKELFIARYYISTKKWASAVNRLKNIINLYDKTIFIEEALHRLVEIHYYLGLDDEAKNYAKILGYNYNSSEWFEQSYKILNKDYKIQSIEKNFKKDSFIKKILNKIK